MDSNRRVMSPSPERNSFDSLRTTSNDDLILESYILTVINELKIPLGRDMAPIKCFAGHPGHKPE